MQQLTRVKIAEQVTENGAGLWWVCGETFTLRALRDTARTHPIAELLRATRGYMASLPDRKRVVTIEYTLIREVNDLHEHARELAELLRDLPCKINLIPFNPFPQSSYQRPEARRVERFQRRLQEAGYIVTVRTTRGDDIDAACGQLVGRVIDRTRRNERYRTQLAQKDSIITRVS